MYFPVLGLRALRDLVPAGLLRVVFVLFIFATPSSQAEMGVAIYVSIYLARLRSLVTTLSRLLRLNLIQ